MLSTNLILFDFNKCEWRNEFRVSIRGDELSRFELEMHVENVQFISIGAYLNGENESNVVRHNNEIAG